MNVQFLAIHLHLIFLWTFGRPHCGGAIYVRVQVRCAGAVNVRDEFDHTPNEIFQLVQL